MTKALPYPPPWQDTVTLAQHISVSAATVENWVSAGILPPPRRRGGKLMWKWSEVDAWLSGGKDADRPGSVTDAVKREREADRHAGH
jgi:predicted DNA-binding transcriptional regulator AlpA